MEYKLTQEEINNLIELHKTIKIKIEADKIKCLILWGKGWKWEDIKEALLISDHFISDIKNKYSNNKNKILEIIKNKCTGNNYKMSKEQEAQLIKFIDENYIPTAKMVCDYVKLHFNLLYTENGMVQTLKRLGFSYKKPKILPGKIPDKQTQEEFAEKIDNIIDNLEENEAFYFTDGAGLVHNLKEGYGWIKKGKEKNIKSNTGRSKININGAYDPIKQETITIHQDGSVSVNQQSNIALVEKIIKSHPKLKKIYICLDNAKSNYGKDFIEYINSLKKVKIILIYLPPYSPNLNLIERLWKYLKKCLLFQYYEKFGDFKNRVYGFLENEINQEVHKNKLKTFIGRNFRIIESPL